MRIAHLVTRLSMGGMENAVTSIIRGLPADRYHSALWCLEAADVLGRELRALDYEVIELGRRRRRDFRLFINIARLVRGKRIDVLHCYDELSWFYGNLGARLGGMGCILMTMQGRRLDISSRHKREQRVLAKLTKGITTVSYYLRQQIINELRVPPEKVAVVPNGIPLVPRSSSAQREKTRVGLGLPEDAVVLGSVARFAPVKNLELLLEAVGKARVDVPCLRVVLIGDGPCRQDLVRKAAALGLTELVVFTGARRDVADLLTGLDVYVCSSNYEGISLSILEAMRAERAVIATAVGGNTEIIQHNSNGILVERGNPQAMAQAIIKLSRDGSMRRLLGEQARRVVEADYSIGHMVDKYDLLYQAMLSPRYRAQGLATTSTSNSDSRTCSTD